MCARARQPASEGASSSASPPSLQHAESTVAPLERVLDAVHAHPPPPLAQGGLPLGALPPDLASQRVRWPPPPAPAPAPSPAARVHTQHRPSARAHGACHSQ
eukprot:7122483-Prymnesium_polylepis.1